MAAKHKKDKGGKAQGAQAATVEVSKPPCALFAVPLPDVSPEQRAELDKLSAALDARLSGHRLVHSRGVADTAGRLASLYGVDPFLAQAAGLLHDWDKKLPVEELWAKMARYGVDTGGLALGDGRLVPLLHGWTAAASLPEEFPELPAEVFRAVARHTVGVTDMSALDMVVFVADMLEPGRTGADIEGLRSSAGSVSLPALFAACVRQSIACVLETGRFVYPGAVEVWNAYCTEL